MQTAAQGRGSSDYYTASPKDSQAPDITKLADDKYGQMVRHGKVLMEDTYKHIAPEAKDTNKRYAGNNLGCTSQTARDKS